MPYRNKITATKNSPKAIKRALMLAAGSALLSGAIALGLEFKKNALPVSEKTVNNIQIFALASGIFSTLYGLYFAAGTHAKLRHIEEDSEQIRVRTPTPQ